MKIKLNAIETRILGALVEKEICTPDQYPLSLNGLVNACNQKSNREPVMELDEATVQAQVDGLIRRYLVRSHSGFGSRVAKYQHRLCNTEFGPLRLSPQELAVLCEMLLRGPQTPGELRSRCERLCHFESVEQVEATLSDLSNRDEPLVVRLPRQPGKRENRYGHLLGDDDYAAELHGMELSGPDTATGSTRLERLEQRLTDLEQEVAELRSLLELVMEDSPPSASKSAES